VRRSVGAGPCTIAPAPRHCRETLAAADAAAAAAGASEALVLSLLLVDEIWMMMMTMMQCLYAGRRNR